MTEPFVVCRTSDQEKARERDLFELIPKQGKVALDIGARDGFFSRLLAERFDHVVALDLEKPNIDHPRVEAVKGDASQLEFNDRSFDLVVCAEVLEHIPSNLLDQVCKEISRVAGNEVVIGVPFKQDIRLGRTTCVACNKVNPPYGHVNSFDTAKLLSLFGGLALTKTTFVGANNDVTNAVSAALMDFAGNPYGTYDQEEHCLWCGSKLLPPMGRTLVQKFATKLALLLQDFQQVFTSKRANWIHMRFIKTDLK